MKYPSRAVTFTDSAFSCPLAEQFRAYRETITTVKPPISYEYTWCALPGGVLRPEFRVFGRGGGLIFKQINRTTLTKRVINVFNEHVLSR